jgi:hypothetical protein
MSDAPARTTTRRAPLPLPLMMTLPLTLPLALTLTLTPTLTLTLTLPLNRCCAAALLRCCAAAAPAPAAVQSFMRPPDCHRRVVALPRLTPLPCRCTAAGTALLHRPQAS